MNETLLAWVCGFYEGEGWVSNDKGNNNRIRLGIAQNDRAPLDLIQSFWGGSIKQRIRKSLKGKNCVGHELVLPHVKSLKFINDIKRHMKIPTKINQIEKVLNEFKNGTPIKYTCNDCGNVYANPSARRRHYKNIHQNTDASRTCVLQENQIAGTS